MPGTRLCRAWTQPDTRNHVGETAIVCGKVVGADVLKNTIRGHGFPVSFDLDQPEPNPVFYFVAFGANPTKPSPPTRASAEGLGLLKRTCHIREDVVGVGADESNCSDHDY